MMKNNKKAWIRIVEATVGVLLLASVLFVMVARAPKSSENNIYETQRFALEQISKNETLRGMIMTYDVSTPGDADELAIKAAIDGVAGKLLPAYLGFDTRICGVSDACGILTYPAGADRKDIYSDEILITSTLDTYNPKKLRLFAWEK